MNRVGQTFMEVLYTPQPHLTSKPKVGIKPTLYLWNKVILGLFCSYILLLPFYTFPSGYPQIADYLMLIALGFLIMFVGIRTNKKVALTIWSLGGFVSYAFIANLLWTVSTSDLAVFSYSLYYIYNFLVFLAFVTLFFSMGQRFLFIVLIMVFVSVIAQAALALPLTLGEFRNTLFFNNPNQLGYFALLSATIFTVGCRLLYIKTVYQVIFYASSLFLIILSLSKAAIFGIFFLLLAVLFKRPLMVIISAAVLGIGLFISERGSLLTTNLLIRLGSVGQTFDDNLPARGYDRIINHPEHLVLGAGEGAFYRFGYLSSGEMHSSLGTVLFSYGIFGFFLFVIFLFSIIRFAKLSELFYLFPILFYGFTHQGLRFTLFWILMAFFFCFLISSCRGKRAPKKLSLVADPPTPKVLI